LLLVAVDKELEVRTPLERNSGGGKDDRRAMIAAHRVKSYSDVSRHFASEPAQSALLGRRPAPRDNKASAAYGN
jgi:hypothetical protein